MSGRRVEVVKKMQLNVEVNVRKGRQKCEGKVARNVGRNMEGKLKINVK
jgi:hypothetical protein